MSFAPLHLTLRQLRAVFSDRRALLAIGAVGAVAGLAGPFSTFETLALPLRMAYWLALAFATYAAGLAGAMLLASWLAPQKEPIIRHVLVSAVGAAVPAWAVVIAFNLMFFSGIEGRIGQIGWLFVYVFLICLALMAVLDGVLGPLLAERKAKAVAEIPPPLLARLPHEIRGPLSHLSMADHYVEVTTQKGSALVLLRLADAIAETRGTEGLQIHRSHWVAKSAVKTLKRVEGRLMVETMSGALLPVSRSYLAPVRAAFGTI
ncbi:MAG: LytTR family DNA-binding domain-containing protein [Pararhodobacter sp.]